MHYVRNLSIYLVLWFLFVLGITSGAAQELNELSGGPVLLSENEQDYRPQAEGDIHQNSGKVIYVWGNYADGNTQRNIKCGIYDKDMNAVVGPFRVNNSSLGSNDAVTHPCVRVNQKEGFFVVGWRSNANGNGDVYIKKIQLDITNADTTYYQNIGDVVVDDDNYTQDNPDITFDNDRDEVVVCYRDQYGSGDWRASGRRFDFNLNPIASFFTLEDGGGNNQIVHRFSRILPGSGELLTVYRSDKSGDNDIYKKVFQFNQSTSAYEYVNGSEVRVNDNTYDRQANPTLTVHPTDDAYVIGWSSKYDNGHNYDAMAKVYDKEHNAISGEVRINFGTFQHWKYPCFVWDPSQDHIIAFYFYGDWDSQDGEGTVKYRIFDKTLDPLINVDKEAIGGQDTEANVRDYGRPLYNYTEHRVYLAYDIYVEWNTDDGLVNARYYEYPSPLHETAYGTLKRTLNANHYHATDWQGKLHFYYEEKQKDQATLDYKIYGPSGDIEGSKTVNYGENWLSIDMSSSFYVPGFLGVLEVTEPSGQKKRLRFKYEGP